MMKAIDKLGWLYIRDKKVLCARSKGKQTYYLPGGKRQDAVRIPHEHS